MQISLGSILKTVKARGKTRSRLHCFTRLVLAPSDGRFSSLVYEYAIDYRIEEGWVREDDGVHINPHIYLKQFLSGWEKNGRIWDYRELVPLREREIARYHFIADYLQIEKSNSIRKMLAKLSAEGEGENFTEITAAFEERIDEIPNNQPEQDS